MERALALARSALGRTSPNPAVGAIIVKDGEIVGEGATQPPGSWHAEAMALLQAKEAARGATMYVTLEPCNHYGRTPPCALTIIEAGIAEVHIAMLDPNPHVTGGGRHALEKAGVKTFLGEGEVEASEVMEAFVKYSTTGLPFVIAKYAMSLDGKIATRSGDSKWITGEEARGYVHQLRRQVDAIMVGANTVLLDDPQLTARTPLNPGEDDRQPLRIVVDGQGRVSPNSKVFNAPGRAILATTENADRSLLSSLELNGVTVLTLPEKDGFLDLRALLKALAKIEVTSILVEGGGTLLGSLFDADLVDKVLGFIAPVIIGGENAVSPVKGTGAFDMTAAIRLNRTRVERFGPDTLIIGYV